MPHVHVGFVDVVQWIATMLIAGFLVRSISAKLSQSERFGFIGNALAYIY